MGHISLAAAVVIVFSKSVWGIMSKPYITCRDIARRSDVLEMVPIALLSFGYFALASVVRVKHFRPFILTSHFLKLTSWAIVTFFVSIFFLWAAARIVGGSGKIKTLAVGWSYTLVPSVFWFLSTSILYLILPPPRTQAWQGILFSLVFLIFSSAILYWKIMLGYLTLRFSMHLDLLKIVFVATIFLPFFGIYSFFLYKIGVFRIPFI